ncbi:hypothetical protein HALLA_13685 [Halostagnicola larsenii XH-48]|uniref:MYXO-CTERM domain-containing protein n=1 Tax=Halostagnicola larsenii XH-48 TaxID=797299 RepID=W0JQW7_9EURY|nr:hypothetical protein [Halostagnicola larsenii]AHF99676.1 hypothetical protein HALLA_13685 [Halostagnicola larsenii XH-48]
MPEMEHGDDTLSTLLVKEAVSRGMDSPMREPILEAVEESEGSSSMGGRVLPLAGGLLGLGVAIGYLLGSGELDTDDTPLEDLETPEVLDDVVEDASESTEETETDADETGGSSRLLRLGLLIVGVVGLELLRRRRSGEDEEWEPIEEFEPATSASFDDDSAEEGEDEDEASSEDTEAQADEETEE